MMDFFQWVEETSLPSECGCAYDGMAFDGCYQYLLLPCVCKIIKLDACYRPVACYETHRDYSCMCYDYKDCCFWAASNTCCNKLFRLNPCMQEIDCIPVCGGKEATGVVTGIAYNCCHDTLLVSFLGGVVEVEKSGEESELKYPSPAAWITGICCVCPYTILTVNKDSKQWVILLDSLYQPLHTQEIPWDYHLKTIVFNPCVDHCQGYRFEILANKRGCYPYLLYAWINPCAIRFHPCACNDRICKKCCDKHPCDSRDACTDVLESIALVETALSHILNAEGEKLQKVLASTGDVNKILCVNREINKTLINATHLEHALYAKLSAVLDCCDCGDHCQEDCGCDCWEEQPIP